MRIIIIIFISMLLFGLAGQTRAASIDAAFEAMKTRDFPAALLELRPLAQEGDMWGQYLLGTMYKDGNGVEKDYKIANDWFKLAAAQGHKTAQFFLGVMYSKGFGVEIDYVEAIEWYKKAALQGHESAQFNLGVMYAKGEGVETDYTIAIKWYKKAASQGNSRAVENIIKIENLQKENLKLAAMKEKLKKDKERLKENLKLAALEEKLKKDKARLRELKTARVLCAYYTCKDTQDGRYVYQIKPHWIYAGGIVVDINEITLKEK